MRKRKIIISTMPYIDLSNHVINGGFLESAVSVYFKEFGVDKEVYIEDDFDGFSNVSLMRYRLIILKTNI